MESPRTAEIHDLASYRVKRQALRRKQAGERRRFLWSWPSTGQILAVDFPFSTTKPLPGIAQNR